MGKCKKIICIMLSFVLMFTVIPASQVQAQEKTLKLNKTKCTLDIDQKVKLTLDGKAKGYKWSSSNKKVAKVNSSGVVTAVSSGTATISVKHGKKTYKCKIIVRSAWETLGNYLVKKGKIIDSSVTVWVDGHWKNVRYNNYYIEKKVGKYETVELSYIKKNKAYKKDTIKFEYTYDNKKVRKTAQITHRKGESKVQLYCGYDYYKTTKLPNGGTNWQATDYAYGDEGLKISSYKKNSAIKWKKYYGTSKYSKAVWKSKLNSLAATGFNQTNSILKKRLGYTLKDFGFIKY